MSAARTHARNSIVAARRDTYRTRRGGHGGFQIMKSKGAASRMVSLDRSGAEDGDDEEVDSEDEGLFGHLPKFRINDLNVGHFLHQSHMHRSGPSDVVELMEKHAAGEDVNNEDAPHHFIALRRPLSADERSQRDAEVDRLRRRLKRPESIILPDSWFIRRWDLANILFLIFTGIVTPYEVAVMPEKSTVDGLYVLNQIVNAYFIIDMFVQFNLGFIRHSKKDGDNDSDNINMGAVVETDRFQIAKHYTRTWFLTDLLSCIPYDDIGKWTKSDDVSSLKILRVVRLLRLIKLLRFIKASTIVRRMERRSSLSHSTVMLMKFGVVILIIAHWMACTWCMTVSLQPTRASTWYSALAADDDGTVRNDTYNDEFNMYCAALYWAVATITSVGYGDISATNPTEFKVSIICVLLSSCLWAYIIGSACGIISNLDVATINHHQTLDQLNLFIREYGQNFSQPMKEQLREFFHHSSNLRRTEEYHSNLISKMSPVLQREVTSKYCAWIKDVPYFAHARSAFVVGLVNNATFSLFIPQERIRSCDEIKVVMRGMGSYRHRVISQGAIWGEDFVLGYDSRRPELKRLRNTSWALALTYLEVMMINSYSLELICRSFPVEEAMINRYVRWLAARTNILRVASFIRRCGGVRRAFQRMYEPAPMKEVKPSRLDDFREGRRCSFLGSSTDEPEQQPPRESAPALRAKKAEAGDGTEGDSPDKMELVPRLVEINNHEEMDHVGGMADPGEFGLENEMLAGRAGAVSDNHEAKDATTKLLMKRIMHLESIVMLIANHHGIQVPKVPSKGAKENDRKQTDRRTPKQSILNPNVHIPEANPLGVFNGSEK